MVRQLTRIIAVMALSGIAVCSLQAAELDTQERRLSYALGFQVAQQFKNEGIAIDPDAFTAALTDVLQGNQLQLTIVQMREALKVGREALVQAKQAEAQQALETGRDFLEQNKTKPGVVVLPSGLQYQELVTGKGDTPTADDKVVVHYRGTLISGEEFDSSYSRGQPASFSLGGVIPGFREAISLMRPGAKWQVFIPSELGYGESGAGNDIGPNETLIFEIELISVEPAKAE
jgi:FKBP-type peptidyl-prolyl cis-trans isomerase FklB